MVRDKGRSIAENSRLLPDVMENRMPKIRTNRAAAKRFKRTGTGKFLRAKANKSHILTKKSRQRKRRLRQTTIADAVNTNALRRMLPYL
jgi:large subunit ribosomal protein L35